MSEDLVDRVLVGGPLVVAGLVGLHAVTAGLSAGLLAFGSRSSPELLVPLLPAYLAVSWVGVRTLSGGVSAWGRVGAYALVAVSPVVLLFGSPLSALDAGTLETPLRLGFVSLAVGYGVGVPTIVWRSVDRDTVPSFEAERGLWAVAWHPWLILSGVLAVGLAVVLLEEVSPILVDSDTFVRLMAVPVVAWVLAAGYAATQYDDLVAAHRRAVRGTVSVPDDAVVAPPVARSRLRLSASVVALTGDRLHLAGPYRLSLPTLSVCDEGEKRSVPLSAVTAVTHDDDRLVVETEADRLVVPAAGRPTDLLSELDRHAEVGSATRETDDRRTDPRREGADTDESGDGDPGVAAAERAGLTVADLPGTDRTEEPASPRRRSALFTAGGAGLALLTGAPVGASSRRSDPGITPAAAFDFRYEDGPVTIAHQGGDTFTEDNTRSLSVWVDGDERRQFVLPVSAGDETTVEAGSGSVVEVIWTAPGGRDRQVIADFYGPDA